MPMNFETSRNANRSYISLQKSRPDTTALLLLLDDNTPLMLGTAVHDVAEPVLDLACDLARRTLGTHGDVDIATTVVDLGDGADEVLYIRN